MRWLLLLCLSGCCGPARAVTATYPGDDLGAPATLVIQITQPVSNLHLALNGTEVIAGKHTGRITVTGLPPGELTVMLAGDGLEKVFAVHLDPGQRMTVPVAAPARPPGGPHPVVQALLSVGVYAAYLGLVALF